MTIVDILDMPYTVSELVRSLWLAELPKMRCNRAGDVRAEQAHCPNRMLARISVHAEICPFSERTWIIGGQARQLSKRFESRWNPHTEMCLNKSTEAGTWKGGLMTLHYGPSSGHSIV